MQRKRIHTERKDEMTYKELMAAARADMQFCSACEVCDGRACKNHIPGPGAKGTGDTAARNYDKWKEIRLNMDTITDVTSADTSAEIFGKRFALPVFAGPVGVVERHYGPKYTIETYNDVLIRGCVDAGICAFTGDGNNPAVMREACLSIGRSGGQAIPTVKPWDAGTIAAKMEQVRESGAFAVAMDIDAAGLMFLRGQNPPAGAKTVGELRKIISDAGLPFIVKGIMTASGAKKALDAGADAIVVSNHGGRVLEDCPATAEVLGEIAEALGGKMKILVDGGIRSGADVFKAIALGADAVMIARPFVCAVYGGAEEGVRIYVDKLKTELEDAMMMCGAKTLADIRRDMVRI